MTLSRRSLLGSLLGTVIAVPFFGDFTPRIRETIPSNLEGFRIAFHARDGKATDGRPIEQLWTPKPKGIEIQNPTPGNYNIVFNANPVDIKNEMTWYGMSVWLPDNTLLCTKAFYDSVWCMEDDQIRMTHTLGLSDLYSHEPDDWQFWAGKLKERDGQKTQELLKQWKAM